MSRREEIKIGKDSGRVKVFARVRPLNKDEISKKTGHALEVSEGNCQINVYDGKKKFEKTYQFDHVFSSNQSNEKICEKLSRPMVSSALEGFNGTLMAYGQTGTGKTHTLMAPDGLTHDIINKVFEKTKNDISHEFKVTASYLQIYQEKIHDLLNINNKVELNIRESPKVGIYVENLTEYVVRSPADAFSLITFGRRRLVFAETKMNRTSSRSHSVFQMTIEKVPKKEKCSHENASTKESKKVKNCQENTEEDVVQLMGLANDVIVRGKIHLCDLAGSERVKKTLASGERLSEAQCINSSLLELGNVIQALADNRKTHVPFRNSVLTRLLQESLGGNCKTSLIVCVSPSTTDVSETKSTLNFGSRAMQVTNTAYVNMEVDFKRLSDSLLLKLEEKEMELQQIRNERNSLTTLQSNDLLSKIDVISEESKNAIQSMKQLHENQVTEFKDEILKLTTEIKVKDEQIDRLNSQLESMKRQRNKENEFAKALLISELISLEMLASEETHKVIRKKSEHNMIDQEKLVSDLLRHCEHLVKYSSIFIKALPSRVDETVSRDDNGSGAGPNGSFLFNGVPADLTAFSNDENKHNQSHEINLVNLEANLLSSKAKIDKMLADTFENEKIRSLKASDDCNSSISPIADLCKIMIDKAYLACHIVIENQQLKRKITTLNSKVENQQLKKNITALNSEVENQQLKKNITTLNSQVENQQLKKNMTALNSQVENQQFEKNITTLNSQGESQQLKKKTTTLNCQVEKSKKYITEEDCNEVISEKFNKVTIDHADVEERCSGFENALSKIEDILSLRNEKAEINEKKFKKSWNDKRTNFNRQNTFTISKNVETQTYSADILCSRLRAESSRECVSNENEAMEKGMKKELSPLEINFFEDDDSSLINLISETRDMSKMIDEYMKLDLEISNVKSKMRRNDFNANRKIDKTTYSDVRNNKMNQNSDLSKSLKDLNKIQLIDNENTTQKHDTFKRNIGENNGNILEREERAFCHQETLSSMNIAREILNIGSSKTHRVELESLTAKISLLERENQQLTKRLDDIEAAYSVPASSEPYHCQPDKNLSFSHQKKESWSSKLKFDKNDLMNLSLPNLRCQNYVCICNLWHPQIADYIFFHGNSSKPLWNLQAHQLNNLVYTATIQHKSTSNSKNNDLFCCDYSPKCKFELASKANHHAICLPLTNTSKDLPEIFCFGIKENGDYHVGISDISIKKNPEDISDEIGNVVVKESVEEADKEANSLSCKEEVTQTKFLVDEDDESLKIMPKIDRKNPVIDLQQNGEESNPFRLSEFEIENTDLSDTEILDSDEELDQKLQVYNSVCEKRNILESDSKSLCNIGQNGGLQNITEKKSSKKDIADKISNLETSQLEVKISSTCSDQYRYGDSFISPLIKQDSFQFDAEDDENDTCDTEEQPCNKMDVKCLDLELENKNENVVVKKSWSFSKWFWPKQQKKNQIEEVSVVIQ